MATSRSTTSSIIMATAIAAATAAYYFFSTTSLTVAEKKKKKNTNEQHESSSYMAEKNTKGGKSKNVSKESTENNSNGNGNNSDAHVGQDNCETSNNKVKNNALVIFGIKSSTPSNFTSPLDGCLIMAKKAQEQRLHSNAPTYSSLSLSSMSPCPTTSTSMDNSDVTATVTPTSEVVLSENWTTDSNNNISHCIDTDVLERVEGAETTDVETTIPYKYNDDEDDVVDDGDNDEGMSLLNDDADSHGSGGVAIIVEREYDFVVLMEQWNSKC